MKTRAVAILIAVVAPFAIVTALVVAQDGGGARKRIPLTATREAADATGTMAAPSTMFPYGGIRYEAGPGLPDLTGDATAYKVTANVDAAAAARVARAFGVVGDPVADGSGIGYTVTGDGGGYVSVQPGSGGWFTYGSDVARGVASSGVGCAEPGKPVEPTPAPDTATSSAVPPAGPASSPPAEAAPPSTLVEPVPPVCEPATTVPVRPADLPSQDAAKATALAALKAAGVDVEGADVTVTDGFVAWLVEVRPKVDGVTVEGLAAWAAVDGSGVTNASGSIGRAVAYETYPLIGTAKAIENLDAGADPYGGRLYGTPVPATSACPPGAMCATSGAGASGSSAVGAPTASTVVCTEAPCDQPGCTSTTDAIGNVSGTTCTGGAGAPCPSPASCPAQPLGTCTKSVGTDGSVSESCSATGGAVAPCPAIPPTSSPDGASAAPGCAADCTYSAPGESVPAGSSSAPVPSAPAASVCVCPAVTVPGSPSSDGIASIGTPGCGCPTIAVVNPDGSTSGVPCERCATASDLPMSTDASGGEPPTTVVDGCTAPEPSVVTLTGATLGLLAMPGGNGDTYLVPSYRFTTADGQQGPTAIAIDASWLEPLPVPQPLPAESGGVPGPGCPASLASEGSLPPECVPPPTSEIVPAPAPVN